jgi:hypothetical protein
MLALAIAAGASPASLVAEDKKPEDKQPKILVVMPLGVVAGETAKLTLRGLRIDDVSEIQAGIGDKRVEAKLVGKQKSNLGQNIDAKLGGDSHVEIELTIPSDAAGAVKFVAVTPAGISQAYELPTTPNAELEKEKEPNDGFDTPAKAQAQPISLGKVILGAIERSQDVDVYSVATTAGQTIVAEVTARRLGSPLDAALMLFDERGSILASSDDTADSTDGHIEFISPGGKLYLAVSDANDQGSPGHGYRLTVR